MLLHCSRGMGECPQVRSKSRSSSTSASVSKMKAAAYASLRQDNANVTCKRMALAGKHFLDCDGIETLQRLVGIRDRAGSRVISDDASGPKKALPRNAHPLAQFLYLHVANQANHLGAAIGRRMESFAPQSSKSGRTGKSRSAQGSWRVSPLLFSVIMSFTKVHVKTVGSMVGGHQFPGANGTQVYTIDELADVHPDMTKLWVHGFQEGPDSAITPKLCVGRDGTEVTEELGAFLKEMNWKQVVLKEVARQEYAKHEIMHHNRLFSWFGESLGFTSLHPNIQFILIEENPPEDFFITLRTDSPAVQTLLVVSRLMDGHILGLTLTKNELLEVAGNVLLVLSCFHANESLHMDVKPTNIFWEWGPSRLTSVHSRNFCLGDYDLVTEASFVRDYLHADNFEAMVRGTVGFMSPLLTEDEHTETYTYPIFEFVARQRQVFPSNEMPIWRDYFRTHRQMTDVYKVDLHSLALALFKTAVPQNDLTTLTQDQLGLIQGPLGQILARLMFFREQDFTDANDAIIRFKSAILDKS